MFRGTAFLAICLGLLWLKDCQGLGKAVPPEELQKIEKIFRIMNPTLNYDTLYYMDQVAGRYSMCNYSSQYLEVYDLIYRGIKDNIGVLIDSLAGKPYGQAVVDMAQKWSSKRPVPRRIQSSKSFGCSLTVNCPPDKRTAFSCAFSAITPTTPAPRINPTESGLISPPWKPQPIRNTPPNPPFPPIGYTDNVHALTPKLYRDVEAELLQVNRGITYDSTYFMDQASAKHNHCPFQEEYTYDTGRVELTLSDRYGVISSVGRNVPYEYEKIYDSVMDMVKDWIDRDFKRITFAQKFGCSVIPACHGNIVLACAFYPIRVPDWITIKTLEPTGHSWPLRDYQMAPPMSKAEDLNSAQVTSARSLFGMLWKNDSLFTNMCHDLAKCTDRNSDRDEHELSGIKLVAIYAQKEKNQLTEDSAILEGLRKIKAVQPQSNSQEFRCCYLSNCNHGESLTVTCLFHGP